MMWAFCNTKECHFILGVLGGFAQPLNSHWHEHISGIHWNSPIPSLYFLLMGKYSLASFVKVVYRYENLIISIALL